MQQGNRGSEDRLSCIESTLNSNAEIYRTFEPDFKPKVPSSIKGLRKAWEVKNSIRTASGERLRDLYINGILFKSRVTYTEARRLMELYE